MKLGHAAKFNIFASLLNLLIYTVSGNIFNLICFGVSGIVAYGCYILDNEEEE